MGRENKGGDLWCPFVVRRGERRLEASESAKANLQ